MVAAIGLDFIQLLVGALDGLVEGLTRLQDRQAAAQGDGHVAGLNARVLGLLAYAFGHAQGVVGMLQEHQHDELFTAPAADQIRGAAHPEQVLAELAEHAVADGMAMGAVTQRYSSAEAAVKAIQAGADIVLMPENYIEAFNGVLAAVKDGSISAARLDESVLRILELKDKYGLL